MECLLKKRPESREKWEWLLKLHRIQTRKVYKCNNYIEQTSTSLVKITIFEHNVDRWVVGLTNLILNSNLNRSNAVRDGPIFSYLPEHTTCWLRKYREPLFPFLYKFTISGLIWARDFHSRKNSSKDTMLIHNKLFVKCISKVLTQYLLYSYK